MGAQFKRRAVCWFHLPSQGRFCGETPDLGRVFAAKFSGPAAFSYFFPPDGANSLVKRLRARCYGRISLNVLASKHPYEVNDAVEVGELIARLESMLMELYELEDPSIPDEVLRFAFLISVKYENCLSFRLYHLLIGSTPEDCDRLDFDGKDSVLRFVRRLHRNHCRRRRATEPAIGDRVG